MSEETGPIIPPLVLPYFPPRRPLGNPAARPAAWRCVDCGWEENERCLICPNCATDGALAAEEQPATPPADATAPEAYQDRASGPPRPVDGPGCTPTTAPAPRPPDSRIVAAYDTLQKARAALQDAYEEGTPDAFTTELGRYSRALLDCVRALQAPMWGPKYTVDPRLVAPDDFLDESISWAGRKDYAARVMARARAAR